MSDFIRGIEGSVENGADIVTLSLGTYVYDVEYSKGQLNLSETSIEDITVYFDYYENIPYNIDTSSSFKPTYIIGCVALNEMDHMWGAQGTDLSTLSRTFDLSSVTTTTLEFETAYDVDVSSFSMNAVLDCLAPDNILLDRGPDTGYGTYPGMDITIYMMGISWNSSSGLPDKGMNITFDVYRFSDYRDDLSPSYSITEKTNAQGIAEASAQMKQENSYYICIGDDARINFYLAEKIQEL